MGGPAKRKRAPKGPIAAPVGAYQDGSTADDLQPNYNVGSVNTTGAAPLKPYGGSIELIPTQTGNPLPFDPSLTNGIFWQGRSFFLSAGQSYRVKLRTQFTDFLITENIVAPGMSPFNPPLTYFQNLQTYMRNCALRLFRGGTQVCEWFPAYQIEMGFNNSVADPVAGLGDTNFGRVSNPRICMPGVEFDEMEFFAGYVNSAAAPPVVNFAWNPLVYVARAPASFITR